MSQPALNAPAKAGAAWTKITLPFALPRAYDKDEGQVFFTVGLREQTVEIGGIELVDYGTAKKVAELPFTSIGYRGRESSARGARRPTNVLKKSERAISQF